MTDQEIDALWAGEGLRIEQIEFRRGIAKQAIEALQAENGQLHASLQSARTAFEQVCKHRDALQAKLDELQRQEPVAHQFQTEIDKKWHNFIDAEHYHHTVDDGRLPIRALYAAPKAAVSHPKTETTPATEGVAITSESAANAVQPDFSDQATIAGLEASIGHLSALVNEQLLLLEEVNDNLGVDGLGAELDDDQSPTIAKVRAHLAVMAPPTRPVVQPQAQGEVSWNLRYADSTPKLNVGNSAFEDWFQQQPFATQIGVKQMCRDSYAAGMGDPLVTYAHPQATEPAWRPIESAPKDGRKIIVTYANRNGLKRTVMACWLTDEAAAETDTDDVGLEEGWYECIDNWNDYTEIAIHEGEPSHWMPLPSPPKDDL